MKSLLLIPLLFVCSIVIGQSKKIIGKPIRIGNIEVAQNDLGYLVDWEAAKAACSSLGKGWRLPTKDELNLLYTNRLFIGGFGEGLYWSSTNGTSGFDLDGNEMVKYYAWVKSLDDGFEMEIFKTYGEVNVRAVRNL